jgi:CelD/BcsL family acetyltransferase involved in cellulose biosynthesis
MPRSTISIINIKRYEDIEPILPVWRQLQVTTNRMTPQSDPDHYQTVIRYSPGVISPLVLLIMENGNPSGLILGRHEISAHNFAIGYKRIASIPVRRIVLMYGGDLIGDSPSKVQYAVEALINEASRIGADLVFANGIAADESLSRYLRSSRRMYIPSYSSQVQLHWTMQIPHSIAEWDKLHSKKHLSNLRSRMRKLENLEKAELRMRRFQKLNEVEEMLKEVETIARLTYQRGMGVGFFPDLLQRQLLFLAAQKRWLRAYILYIGDRPCAFQLGFEYGNTYFVRGKGYDPAFREYAVGTILFRKMLEEFCEEGKISIWDFGIGDADYKRSLGTGSVKECFIHLFAKSPKGIILATGHTLAGLARRSLEAFTRKTETITTVKRWWRRRLAPSSRKGTDKS